MAFSGTSTMSGKHARNNGDISVSHDSSKPNDSLAKWLGIASVLCMLVCVAGMCFLAVWFHSERERILQQFDTLEKIVHAAQVEPHPKAASFREHNDIKVKNGHQPRRKRSGNHNVPVCGSPSTRWGHLVTQRTSVEFESTNDTDRRLSFKWQSSYPARNDFNSLSRSATVPFVISTGGAYLVYGQVTFNGRKTRDFESYDHCSFEIMLKPRDRRRNHEGDRMVLLSGHANQNNNGLPLGNISWNTVYPIDSVFTAGVFEFCSGDKLYMRLSSMSTNCQVMDHSDKVYLGLVRLP